MSSVLAFIDSQADYDDDQGDMVFDEGDEYDEALRQHEEEKRRRASGRASSPIQLDSEDESPSASKGASVVRRPSPDLAEEAAEAIAALRGPRAQREKPAKPQPPRPAAPAAPVAMDDVPTPPEEVATATTSMGKKTNRVVFTINNPPKDWEPEWDEKRMEYLVYQWEVGKKGTLHIQGYLRLKRRATFTNIQKLLGEHAALKVARGNEQQCRDYCTKEDTRVRVGKEYGDYDPDAGKQGRRTDLESVVADCRAGKTLREIAMYHPTEWIKYHAGIQSLHVQVRPAPPVRREVQILVMWGPTGTGKTHRVLTAQDLFTDGGVFSVTPGRGPWDTYRGQKTVFFDEFDYTKWDINEMKRLLDVWLMELPCRYQNKFAEWTRVIICSNPSPMTWYPNADVCDRDALRRRLGKQCRHITNRAQDPKDLPPEPDFGYLLPRPMDNVIAPDSQPPSPTQVM